MMIGKKNVSKFCTNDRGVRLKKATRKRKRFQECSIMTIRQRLTSTNSKLCGVSSPNGKRFFIILIKIKAAPSIKTNFVTQWPHSVKRKTSRKTKRKENYAPCIRITFDRHASIRWILFSIGMFDQDGSSTIDFQEFRALWRYVSEWEKCFRFVDPWEN